MNDSFGIGNNSSADIPVHYGYPYNLLPFWICLALETMVTIFGNALLCWLFFTNKVLRTGQNYFIISLSIGDMFAGVAVVPCEYCRWIRAGIVCPFICGSAISFIMTVTVINLLLIAADRYLAIQKPFAYVRLFTKKRVLRIIGIGWAVAISICTLPLFWQFNPVIPPITKMYINLSYAATLFCLTIISGILVALSYTNILKTRKKSRRKISYCRAREQENSTGVRVYIMTTVLYFVNWIQYCVVEIMLQCRINVSAEVMDASYFVFMLSPCLDSIMYAYYRQDFRKFLVAWCKRQCIPLQNFCHWMGGRFSSWMGGRCLSSNTECRKEAEEYNMEQFIVSSV